MSRPWQQFERLTAAIEALVHRGAQVRWNRRIRGRQIDVEVRFGTQAGSPVLVVECKWRRAGKRVRVDAIEAFASKAKRLGAARAAFATNGGYQTGAVEAARELNVELYTINQILRAWPTVIHETLHQPVLNIYGLVVKTPTGLSCPLPDNSSLANMQFRIPGSSEVPLGYLVSRAFPEWRQHIQPYRFEIELPSGCEMKLPGAEHYTAASSLLLTARALMIPHRVATEPPSEIRPTSIRYTDVFSGNSMEVNDVDLPIGFDSHLEAGCFHRNAWGLEYKCEAVNGSEAQLVLLPTKPQHGTVLSARIVIDTRFGERYEAIMDAEVLDRLERAYVEFQTYSTRPDKVGRGRVIRLPERGVVLMRENN